MKPIILLSALLMALSGVVNAETLKVKSVERQLGEQSQAIIKQGAHGAQAKGLSKQAQSDNSKDSGHAAKQAAPGRTLLQRTEQVSNPDFWIYDAFVTLNVDEDFDGYYSDFTVEFDADSIYTDVAVYARLYLSRGDVFEEYHTTSIFIIDGDSSQDAFVVESELLSGFPPGDYEVLIELYDAIDDSLVAIFDGNNDADLTFISLESKTYEETQSVIIIEEGGSFGYLLLLGLSLMIHRRMRGY